ncbi:MAG: hypothetical protein HYY26_07020 [Acidobacteria bacterium]|nr:hypothetical protein [Acidobacteriota bacterium]
MRKVAVMLGVLLLFAGVGWAQAQEESLADVARRVRAERAKKDLSKVRLFTNDDIPRGGVVISTLGEPAAPPAEAGAAPAAAAAEEKKEECDEQCWRDKFREKREAIRTAEREVDILQREYNLARMQFYQDPNRAMREQYSATTAGGRELQDLLNRINKKQAEIEHLKRELSSLEDELRRAGGKPGWARE